MGYKAPAVHRAGTYKSDCDCVRGGFRDYKSAKLHVLGCPKASKIFYNPSYGSPQEVFIKA